MTKTEERTKQKEAESAKQKKRRLNIQRLKVERDRKLGELAIEYQDKRAQIYRSYQGLIDNLRAR
jgi:hypothetical protein